MYQSLPFADRRQRRDARPDRHPSRCVLVGKREFFNAADPADYREHPFTGRLRSPFQASGGCRPRAPGGQCLHRRDDES